MTDCYNTDHFKLVNGGLTPQEHMQWRHVASVSVPSKHGKYPVTGSTASADVLGTLGSLFGGLFGSIGSIFGISGALAGLNSSASAAGNKNDLLHDITVSWTNDGPIAQWVYGKITQGGARVALQARSRGGLLISSGYKQDVSDAGALKEASMFGCGANLGNAGTLNIGTSFGVHELRQSSHTLPLAPERPGWYSLAAGQTLTARATMRFISEYWETTSIDGGDSGTESAYETGGMRLDLFAVPVI